MRDAGSVGWHPRLFTLKPVGLQTLCTGNPLDRIAVSHKVSDIKMLVTRQFIREFRKHRNEVCQVEQDGKVLGTWTPAAEEPPYVDFAARRKKFFKKPLPFTGAELLKQERR